MRRRFVSWLWLLAPLGLGSVACDDAAASRAKVTIFAASSLREAFTALQRGFEQRQPGVQLSLTFAGSQVLRMQIEQGAAADLFASANARHIDRLNGTASIDHRTVFARNALVVITATDREGGVRAHGLPAGRDGARRPLRRFAELPRVRRLVIGSPEVPVGAYTRQLFAKARLQLGAPFVERLRGRVVSRESNVRLVRAKVELGEADAAIVYRTDVTSGVAARLRVVDIPATLAVEASYTIASLRSSTSGRGAQTRQLIDYLVSAAGQRVLAEHGFTPVRR